jgi:hypothetical protein
VTGEQEGIGGNGVISEGGGIAGTDGTGRSAVVENDEDRTRVPGH